MTDSIRIKRQHRRTTRIPCTMLRLLGRMPRITRIRSSFTRRSPFLIIRSFTSIQSHRLYCKDRHLTIDRSYPNKRLVFRSYMSIAGKDISQINSLHIYLCDSVIHRFNKYNQSRPRWQPLHQPLLSPKTSSDSSTP